MMRPGSSVPLSEADAMPGLLVGLEIHQQLATGRKLFCSCRPSEASVPSRKFSRRLRASKSEMGEYDPAAVFEKAKSRIAVYGASPGSSCLVEEDEEPPHEVDPVSKETSLIVASALRSKIFREIFVMRKIVIDGSNTSGFQRTMLISSGGELDAGGRKVGVQSICLEEDAARLVSDSSGSREYALDRLGVPLIEIALEPVPAGPKEMRRIAHALGKLLRTTKRAARGLGSIRQDVNVSLSGGNVVEVKGVQQLDQLEKVVDFEAKRQDGLRQIARKLDGLDISIKPDDIFDAADALSGCSSKIIQKSIKNGEAVRAVLVRNFAGFFGYEPHPGIRIGKEIAQIARSFGIGGVFHSDELPNYGIGEGDIRALRDKMRAGPRDAFLIVAADHARIKHMLSATSARIVQAARGVPGETRQAGQNGETVFLRPRPGPSRMYPETDIAPIYVNDAELEHAAGSIPQPWDEMLAGFVARYGINEQLAEQVLDSPYLDAFEDIVRRRLAPANFAASAVCSTVTSLQRKGFGRQLRPQHVLDAFELYASGSIPKESIEIIFERIMSGKADSVQDAAAGLQVMDEGELDRILRDIAGSNTDMISRSGERALGALMGIAMKSLRGRAPGSMINAKLRQILKEQASG